MSKYHWEIVPGTCVCGHSWEDHHLGLIMNEDTMKELRSRYKNPPPYLPQECEFYGCNETGGLDEDGNDHCKQYKDKDNTD